MPLRGIRSSQSSLIAGALIRAGVDVARLEVPGSKVHTLPTGENEMMYAAGIGFSAPPQALDGPQSSGPIKYGKPSRDQKLHRKSGGSQNHCGCGKPISANKDQCLGCKQAKESA